MPSDSDLERTVTTLRQRVDTIEEVLCGIRNEVVLANHRDRTDGGLDVVYLGRTLRNIENELKKLGL